MILTIKHNSMNKKQNYTAPEVVSLKLYPRESVLVDVSIMTIMATMSPSDDAKDMIVSETEAW